MQTCLNGRGIRDQEANSTNAIRAHNHTGCTYRQRDTVNLKYFWVLPVMSNVRNSTLRFICVTL